MLSPSAKQRTSNLDQLVVNLREEVESLRRDKTDTERRLNDVEHSYRVCETQRQSSHQHQRAGARDQQQHSQQVS